MLSFGGLLSLLNCEYNLTLPSSSRINLTFRSLFNDCFGQLQIFPRYLLTNKFVLLFCFGPWNKYKVAIWLHLQSKNGFLFWVSEARQQISVEMTKWKHSPLSLVCLFGLSAASFIYFGRNNILSSKFVVSFSGKMLTIQW